MPVRANKENLRYLRTKRDRMGHDLDGLENWDGPDNWDPHGTLDSAAGDGGPA
mgnify:CR=1 FL=1